jgi:hypothetical protein
MLLGSGQDALEPHDDQIIDQVGSRTPLGPRPMYSCSKRLMPSELALSISPDVRTRTSHASPIRKCNVPKNAEPVQKSA